MAFWGKKSASDILVKSFKTDGITYKLEDNVLSFEFPIGSTLLYPYITIDEESNEFTVVINIKKTNLKNLEQLNIFNINSRYFKACYKEDLIYLSYVFTSNEDIREELNRVLGSLKALIDEIQKF
jgi:hypothetical protein